MPGICKWFPRLSLLDKISAITQEHIIQCDQSSKVPVIYHIWLLCPVSFDRAVWYLIPLHSQSCSEFDQTRVNMNHEASAIPDPSRPGSQIEYPLPERRPRRLWI